MYIKDPRLIRITSSNSPVSLSFVLRDSKSFRGQAYEKGTRTTCAHVTLSFLPQEQIFSLGRDVTDSF